MEYIILDNSYGDLITGTIEDYDFRLVSNDGETSVLILSGWGKVIEITECATDLSPKVISNLLKEELGIDTLEVSLYYYLTPAVEDLNLKRLFD